MSQISLYVVFIWSASQCCGIMYCAIFSSLWASVNYFIMKVISSSGIRSLNSFTSKSWSVSLNQFFSCPIPLKQFPFVCRVRCYHICKIFWCGGIQARPVYFTFVSIVVKRPWLNLRLWVGSVGLDLEVSSFCFPYIHVRFMLQS